MKRNEKEIFDLLNLATDSEEGGISKYPGMSYEQGVKLLLNG